MPTYDAEILADLPVAYWKGEDLAGTVMTDLSGNANHGTIFTTAPLPTLGIPGPIETDGTSLGVSGRFGEHATVSGTAMDLRGNYTWEAWGAVNDLIQDYGMLCRNGSLAFTGSNLLAFNSGFIYARVSDGTITRDLDGGVAVALDTYYHVVLTRNSNVLTLYVNGEIVDQRADFIVGDVVYASYNDGDWTVGALRTSVSGGGTTSNGYRTSHVAIYPAALSTARILAHYEAAINALLLRGQSVVVPSAILYSSVEPTPVSFPFRHNWDEPLIERINFLTNTSQAVDGAEEGVQVRLGVRRELEFTQVLKNSAERRLLRAHLWANQHIPWFVPVRQDAALLDSPLSIGATTIPIDPTYRDYEVGGWLGLRQLNDAGEIVHWEEVVISALGSQITVAPLVNAYTPPALAYPVRRAILQPSASLDGHSAIVEETTLTARFLPQDEALVPRRITPLVLTTKYRDYEVFEPSVWQSNDWSDLREYGVERRGEPVDFETGVFTFESDTSTASEFFSYGMKLKGRALIAQFLGWYYERAGSLNYLWVPSLQEDFEPLSRSAEFLTVTGTIYSDTYALAEGRRDLAFVYHDNTMVLRRVVAFSGATNETLELDLAVPAFTNLRSVSLLKFCRLDADQLELAWHTDDVVEVRWRFRELANSPEGTGATSLSPSASRSSSTSPSVSPSPSPSTSPSISTSPSVSPSGSASPSTSASPSSSVSPTPSASQSPSTSVSPSLSPSASASPSSSASPSP